MNELSREILSDWQVRKTKKQKLAFETFLSERLKEDGFEVRVEEKGSSRNLVVGDPDSAKVVFCAHYDTQPVLPLPNIVTPKNLPFFVLYQLLIAVLLCGPGLALEFGMIYLGCGFWPSLLTLYLWLIGAMYLLLAGPANRHTANDNTSGVITVVETMILLRERGLVSDAAFVLFDNEEKGMLGSSAFASAHKKSCRGLIVNFDCVSDGDDILLFASKRVRRDEQLAECLERAFIGRGDKRIALNRGVGIYPSDQLCFKRSVGVAAFKKKPVLGLYLDRIHTRRDTVFDERNISLLSERSADFMSSLV